jgi:peptide/nickel transport system substrate-binding protein
LKDAERKQAVDRVQQIVADQQPFIYLVYPNVLIAVSPRLQGVEPAVLEPALVWNVENLRMRSSQ